MIGGERAQNGEKRQDTLFLLVHCKHSFYGDTTPWNKFSAPLPMQYLANKPWRLTHLHLHSRLDAPRYLLAKNTCAGNHHMPVNYGPKVETDKSPKQR